MFIRSRNGAGIAEFPVNDMPKASAMDAIVEAVPMVLQCPKEGADEQARSINSSYSILPSASNLRLSQMIVPEPARSPFHHPSNIGPPFNAMAGMSTVAAPINIAGVVLSQPVVKTTPSIG